MTSHKPILVDTNIIIYAINRSSPKHTAAQDYLQKHQRDLVVAHQNCIEAIRVLTHPKFSSPMTASRAQQAIAAISSHIELIYPTIETYEFFSELLHKYLRTGNGVFDLYLVATMLSHDVVSIATDNLKDFVGIGEIRATNPCVRV